jgi:hypothetical protein
MKALNKLKEATKFLEGSGIEDAVREAETIIVHCLETDRTALLRDNPLITENVIEKIDEFLERRSMREPLQYILGYVDFLGMKIKVGKGVLIPRPETELLAEVAIRTIRSQQSKQPSLISNPPLPPPPEAEKGGVMKTVVGLVTRHLSLVTRYYLSWISAPAADVWLLPLLKNFLMPRSMVLIYQKWRSNMQKKMQKLTA